MQTKDGQRRQGNTEVPFEPQFPSCIKSVNLRNALVSASKKVCITLSNTHLTLSYPHFTLSNINFTLSNTHIKY